MKPRGRDEIIAEMLRAARERPVPKTVLMSLARLNYAQLTDQYLPYIVDNDLVVEDHGLYSITKKGLDFISAQERLQEVKAKA